MECRTCGTQFSKTEVKEELDAVIGGWESTFPFGLDVCLDCALDELDFDSEGFACGACGNPAYPDCKSSCALYDD